jgi:hypothetical protein
MSPRSARSTRRPGPLRRHILALLAPPRPANPPTASLPDLVATVRAAEALPPGIAEPLLALLLDLRAQRISPAELWRRWEPLPADPPGRLKAVRTFLEGWLYWRDHGMQFGLMPSTNRTSRPHPLPRLAGPPNQPPQDHLSGLRDHPRGRAGWQRG